MNYKIGVVIEAYEGDEATAQNKQVVGADDVVTNKKDIPDAAAHVVRSELLKQLK